MCWAIKTEILKIFESSASIKNAQLVGTQSGEKATIGQDTLPLKLKRVPQIKKKQHHFVFISSKPGIVPIKEITDTETTELSLL